MSNDALHRLAEIAGVATRWNDYRNAPHEVSPASLRKILSALELPCDSEVQAADTLARLREDRAHPVLPPMLTAVVGQPISLPAVAGLAGKSLSIILEDGRCIEAPPRAAADNKLELSPIAEAGYHRFDVNGETITIAVAPQQCFGTHDIQRPIRRDSPDDVHGNSGDRIANRNPWGLAAQLYSLRRAGDGGIGDFTALAELARRAAVAGADAIAVSPVHALFAADVQRFSPYAPSSRLFVNALHADPAVTFGSTAVIEMIGELGLGEELKRLEMLPLIDWPAAATARLKLMRTLFDRLGEPHAASPAFAKFCTAGGGALEDHARFEAIHAQQFSADPARWNWRTWIGGLGDPRNLAVTQFAHGHAREIGFHKFLQWLADRGLADAQAAAREAGMAIGLIGDLAVGTDAGGSHAWSRQRDMLSGMSVGAPPDLLNLRGQNWGLTAFSPRALQQQGYAPFLETLRAALRHAGGLRIDHVLGLFRLWLVPDGAEAIDGAYLRYPLQDLLRLIALESHRARAVIVGEDLGTVPEGFRDRMDEVGAMGMRVLWFEREHRLFVDPSRWSTTAMATPTTHDLPTVAGWWQGRDVDWRVKLDHLPPGVSEADERSERQEDRQMLWAAFMHAGVASGQPPPVAEPAAFIDAAIDFVARTPAPLVIVPVEDIVGLAEQPNLPGTLDEHPNWRRRLPASVEQILETPAATTRLGLLKRGRSQR